MQLCMQVRHGGLCDLQPLVVFQELGHTAISCKQWQLHVKLGPAVSNYSAKGKSAHLNSIGVLRNRGA